MKKNKPADDFEPDANDTNVAVREAHMNATRGARPRVRPLGFGCVIFVAMLIVSAGMFSIALVAAVCAHRWGLS